MKGAGDELEKTMKKTLIAGLFAFGLSTAAGAQQLPPATPQTPPADTTLPAPTPPADPALTPVPSEPVAEPAPVPTTDDAAPPADPATDDGTAKKDRKKPR